MVVVNSIMQFSNMQLIQQELMVTRRSIRDQIRTQIDQLYKKDDRLFSHRD